MAYDATRDHAAAMKALHGGTFESLVEIAKLQLQIDRITAHMNGEPLNAEDFISAAIEMLMIAHSTLGMAGVESADRLMHNLADYILKNYNVKVGVHNAK